VIQKLLKYLSCLFHIIRSKQGRSLLINEIDAQVYRKAYTAGINSNIKWKALEQAITWLKTSQDNMLDDGFGTYYICTGWTTSYPETSGYIIPTLLRFSRKNADDELRERIKYSLDWLLLIQKPEGGWQSGYVDQHRDAVVFNTGQVMRGMLAGHHFFQEQKYLEAAQKAADWLVTLQDQSGAFNKRVFLNQPRVYDSYVMAPVLALNKVVDNEHYLRMVEKNIDWIVNTQQSPNGWFSNCDNTLHKNHKPIIHTIAYTVDGLLDMGMMMNRPDVIQAAQKPADKLMELFLSQRKLHGRYDQNWQGSESFITTGGAQLAIIWYKLHEYTSDPDYKKAYRQMNSLLTALQQRSVQQSPNTKGALFGSFPMWGRYEPFGCPNWATKYLADSLMNEAGYGQLDY
jgi:uncharacterized protein YyaL (SSP411 family)